MSTENKKATDAAVVPLVSDEVLDELMLVPMLRAPNYWALMGC